jgi:imidazolonepropionase-like amidohydrolase
VRQRYQDGSDTIKITATGGVLSYARSGDGPQFTVEEIRAVVEAAADYGYTVAAHAHGKEGMRRAIEGGVASIEHGTYMDDEIFALMKRHGTWYVPTISAGRFVQAKSRIDGYYPEIVRPKAATIGGLIQDTLARAYRAGVKIAFGTDAGVSLHGDNAEEFVFMVEAGMPAGEALQTATLNAAQVLGLAEEIGTAEVGKRADIIAVAGRNATVLTGTGERLDGADVLMSNGRIERVGTGLRAPRGAVEIDGTGKWVTPGIIDVHSHLGVYYPSPGASAHSDGNEMTAPVTAQVWAEHSVWPQDPGFAAALAGGVTSLMILPGSANLIGGRGVTLKNVYATTMQDMKFPGAPHGLKMACGENPKRVYGSRNQAPMTRMGNMAGYRGAFIEAQRYRESWAKHRANRSGNNNDAPNVDLRLETLAGVLDGEIMLHIHCYRADEMALMMDLAREFEFEIAAFHHGVEAYKLADELAEAGICGALWADWWGFKMEAYDAIQENIALVDRPANGARSCIRTPPRASSGSTRRPPR